MKPPQINNMNFCNDPEPILKGSHGERFPATRGLLARWPGSTPRKMHSAWLSLASIIAFLPASVNCARSAEVSEVKSQEGKSQDGHNFSTETQK
jgi:hypothetical protein